MQRVGTAIFVCPGCKQELHRGGVVALGGGGGAETKKSKKKNGKAETPNPLYLSRASLGLGSGAWGSCVGL